MALFLKPATLAKTAQNFVTFYKVLILSIDEVMENGDWDSSMAEI